MVIRSSHRTRLLQKYEIPIVEQILKCLNLKYPSSFLAHARTDLDITTAILIISLAIAAKLELQGNS